jgi:PilZ domain-containing protein
MTTLPSLRPLSEPVPIRLRAFYRSPGTLLRELSRALNRGHTTLRGESGLPAGTRLVLVMVANALTEPIEVMGTITECRRRGARFATGLRYDFDLGPHRARIAAAVEVLKRETRRPRREPRIPLALRVDARGLAVTLINASRGGGQIELRGAKVPALAPGSQLHLSLSGNRPGTRAVVRVVFEVRWAGPLEREGRRRRLVVGGRFRPGTPGVRKRLASILRFEDLTPRIRIRRVVAAGRGRAR